MQKFTLESKTAQIRAEGFVFVKPGTKDQAAIDRELEKVKAEIRREMDAEIGRKEKIPYEFKPAEKPDYQKQK